MGLTEINDSCIINSDKGERGHFFYLSNPIYATKYRMLHGKGGMPMKKMKCPNCGRRAFDISNLPKEEVEVNLKCPQCGKFVSIPCNEKSELKAS